MDKSWTRKPSNTTEYLFGLNQSLDFAFASFQRTGQTTPCIQPTPFQAASLPTPSFQCRRQQTASFQATTLPTPSFQATGQTTPSFQPPINPTPAQATSNKCAKRESSHHWTIDGIDSHGDTKRLKLKTREALSLPQGERVVVEFDCLDPIGEAQGLLAGMAEIGSKSRRAQLYLATYTKKDGSYVNEEAKEICDKIELALSESTVDESEISPNDAVGKVLDKEHPGRVRCLGLGATPSNTFRETNLRPGNIRIVSNNVRCSSSGCQKKYNQLMNTLKAYMIMKEGSIPEQFAGIFASIPTTPSDAASGPVSPTDARRCNNNPSDNH